MNPDLPTNRLWFYGAERRLAKKLPFFRTADPARLLVYPAAVFLYDTPAAAARSGSVITPVHIKKDGDILDAANDWASSERLRLEVASHHLLKHSDNCNQEFWHKGWNTGEMLRMSVSVSAFEHKIHQQVSREAEELNKPVKQVYVEFILNLSREITGHILKTAATMGYNGLSGYAPDESGVFKRCRFLAVFSPHIIKGSSRITIEV